MALISVPVLYDNNYKYFPGGKIMTIDLLSQPSSYRFFQIPPIPGVVGQVDPVQTLEVKTKNFGTLFLNWTLDQFNAVAGSGSLTPPIPATYTYTVGTDITLSGNILSSASIANSVVLGITIGGIAIDIRTIPYTSAGTLDFTSQSGNVGNGAVIAISVYKT